ncbi:uncharacterized protein LOC116347263 [Contarinia nasturtii]|uniref:uncharacterized protein LOC116347263 n=1 Tax=Contarinia nasturtii TaxID=265458 RepID=UPI0012D3F8AE|nr:uncharacterized protein LOC116347263 [Contarinia nasturtii]
MRFLSSLCFLVLVSIAMGAPGLNNGVNKAAEFLSKNPMAAIRNVAAKVPKNPVGAGIAAACATAVVGTAAAMSGASNHPIKTGAAVGGLTFAAGVLNQVKKFPK